MFEALLIFGVFVTIAVMPPAFDLDKINLIDLPMLAVDSYDAIAIILLSSLMIFFIYLVWKKDEKNNQLLDFLSLSSNFYLLGYVFFYKSYIFMQQNGYVINEEMATNYLYALGVVAFLLSTSMMSQVDNLRKRLIKALKSDEENRDSLTQQ